MSIDMYEPAVIPGITYKDAPVAYHGAWEHGYVRPGRRAVAGDWPAERPEDCTTQKENDVAWLAGGEVLVCLGCGLDQT